MSDTEAVEREPVRAMPGRPGIPRRILFALVLVVAAVVMSLAIAEAGLRLLGSHSPQSYHLEPPLGRVRDVETGWDLTYVMNSLGLRDEESSLVPAPGTVRIAAIGDSFTFGQGCERGEIFPDLLEASLNAEGLHAEVINISEVGLGAEAYPVLLRTVALPRRPSLVIVTVYGNDASDLTAAALLNRSIRRVSHRSYLFTLLRAWRRQRSNARMPPFWDIMEAKAGTDERRRALADFRREHGSASNNLIAGCIKDPDDVARWTEPRPDSAGYAELSESLTVMKALCDRSKCPFVIGVVPDGVQVDPDQLRFRQRFGVPLQERVLTEPGRFQALIAQLGQRLGVPVFDPLEDFRAVRSGLYFPYDLHWTAAGHRLYAERLESFLVRRGLLPQARPVPVR